MSVKLNFDGQVAIVTGAGRGLGRAYAKLLASRGAKVVVNDLGGSAFGEGSSRQPADDCVAEIIAAGGEAFANFGDVTSEADVDELVTQTLQRYGRIDILINNAGIARFRPFEQMTRAEFDLMMRVHVAGTWQVTHTVWPHMVKQNYGRIVMTSSSGMAGVGWMSHYATAKAAIYGLMVSLSQEGVAHGIRVNALWPSADTPLFAAIKADIAGDQEQPPVTGSETGPQLIGTADMVAPLVAWLCHEDCKNTGEMFHTGMGLLGRVFIAHGDVIDDRNITMESVRENWHAICHNSGAMPVASAIEAHRVLEAGHR